MPQLASTTLSPSLDGLERVASRLPGGRGAEDPALRLQGPRAPRLRLREPLQKGVGGQECRPGFGSNIAGGLVLSHTHMLSTKGSRNKIHTHWSFSMPRPTPLFRIAVYVGTGRLELGFRLVLPHYQGRGEVARLLRVDGW